MSTCVTVECDNPDCEKTLVGSDEEEYYEAGWVEVQVGLGDDDLLDFCSKQCASDTLYEPEEETA